MRKGITLVTLIVMVVIMLILTTTITITGVNAINNAKKMKFASELLFMQETIDKYIDTHEGNLPIVGDEIVSTNLPSGNYYEIDMSLLGLVDTTYGRKLNEDTEDIYVVSKSNNSVYYLKGLKIGNTVYYNFTEELKNVINYTDTKIVSKDGILFTPSNTNYTNQEISVKVQIPVEYSQVSVLSQDIQITQFTTEENYNVYNVSKTANYDIVVSYTKDQQVLKQVYTVSNYDNEAPTIEVTDMTILKSSDDTKTSITISTNDNLSGVSKILYEVDNVEKAYFETEGKGKIIENNNVVVNKFTKYVTFYVVDKAGNSKILLETLNPTATEDDYVDYGLILHYDAINNTGNGHSSTTTVWKDLSGNGNNGTLTNFDKTTTSGWSDNYLMFDGVDDKVFSELFNSTGDFTIEIKVAEPEVINSANYASIFTINTWRTTLEKPSIIGFIDNRPSSATNLAWCFGILVPSQNSAGYYGGAISYQNIYEDTLSMTKSSDKIVMYKNSKIIVTTNNSEYTTNLNLTDIELYIGNYNNVHHMKQKVYSMRIYNRALTEDEITQNYNIDKIRFGI